MELSIKRIFKRLFPEISGGYHLPHFARVEAISDPSVEPGLSDEFRPRYAVDIVVLTPQGKPNANLPLFRAVPLPVASAGIERGQYGFPDPGSIVEVGFAYGLPSKPFIRTVLARDTGIPGIEPGELLQQAAPGVFDRTKANGDKQRVTHGEISDQGSRYFLDAISSLHTLQEEVHLVAENSTEEVGGIKLIEALGALKLLSAGTLNLAAADNLNQTTASDINTSVGRDLKECVANIRDSIATNKQLIKVENGGKIWLGNEADNVLKILSDLIQVVSDIANTAQNHTHAYTWTDPAGNGNTSKPDQSSDYGSEKVAADSLKETLFPLVE